MLRDDVDPAAVTTLLIGTNVFFFQSADLLRHMPEVRFAGDTTRYTEMLSSILLQGVLQRTKKTSPKTENDALKQDDERQC